MTRTSKPAVLLFTALFAVTAGCGGGSGDGTDGGSTPRATSGVSGTKTVATITDADRTAICDWTAGLYGGYGKTIECGNVGGFDLTIIGPESQAECVAEAAQIPKTCQATVAQAEACVKAAADCDDTNDEAACAAIIACMAIGP
jgi:hypothetical protein